MEDFSEAMKSSFHCLLLRIATLAAIPTHPLAHGQDVVDGPAAVVNGHVVTLSQVRRLTEEKEQSVREKYNCEAPREKLEKIPGQALNELIDERLILEEFEKLTMKGNLVPHVLDDRVDAVIDKLIREEYAGNRVALVRKLDAEGLTFDAFRQEQKDKVIVEMMKQASVRPNPTSGDRQEAEKKWLAKLRKKAVITIVDH
jgi:peptidyl-prolyl cis-trans isomerase SurA